MPFAYISRGANSIYFLKCILVVIVVEDVYICLFLDVVKSWIGLTCHTGHDDAHH